MIKSPLSVIGTSGDTNQTLLRNQVIGGESVTVIEMSFLGLGFPGVIGRHEQ